LMLATLDLVGVEKQRLDIGNIAIFRGLASAAGLSVELTREVFTALRSKDTSTVARLVKSVAEPYRSAFIALPELYGPRSVLERARGKLPSIPEVDLGLGQLLVIANALQDQVDLSFDLTELRGTAYHTGLMFAVYAPGWPDELARGGRYDNVGRRFGRARPATGFSLDLRDLLRILPERDSMRGVRVQSNLLPAAGDEVARMRSRGEVVIIDYLGESAASLNCDRELVEGSSGWQVVPFN
jgi:ATP phosphoribosyltransferase regulatory subunit